MAVNVQCTNQLARVVVNSAIGGASYYLGAQWFTTIPAPTAAVFGATAATINLVTEPLFESIFAQPGANDASKTIGQVAAILTNTITAGLVAKLATGYTITLGSSVPLFFSAVLASFVVSSVLVLLGCGAIFND